MGHTCPDCGQMCYCSGDIDDIDFGEWEGCQHYLTDGCSAFWDDDDDGPDGMALGWPADDDEETPR